MVRYTSDNCRYPVQVKSWLSTLPIANPFIYTRQIIVVAFKVHFGLYNSKVSCQRKKSCVSEYTIQRGTIKIFFICFLAFFGDDLTVIRMALSS